MYKDLKQHEKEILDVFKNTNDEILSGVYILFNSDLFEEDLEMLHIDNVIEVNPGYDEMSVDYELNDYALTKYYKRLITLEKIQND